MPILKLSMLVLLSSAAALPSSAKTFVFKHFKNTNRLTLIGNAASVHTRDGYVLRLVPAQGSQVGAAIGRNRVRLAPNGAFSATFRFRITDPGADGFTLLLARNRAHIGSIGGMGLGYEGVRQSVAVTFDTYQNGGDPGNNQVTVEQDGNVSAHSAGAYGFPYGVSYCTGARRLGCMVNGDVWTVNVTYDGRAMSVAVQDGSNAPSTVVSSYPIDLVGITQSPDVFVGMSAGTGEVSEDIDVLDFTLDTGGGAS